MAQITVLRNALAATGTTILDSRIAFLTLDELGKEYDGFITSVVTSQLGVSITRLPLVVNVASVESKNRDDKKNTLLIFQICTKKGHSTLNYYHRFNSSRFPTNNNNCRLSSTTSQVSVKVTTTSDCVTLWYPNSRATHHITHHSDYITSSCQGGGKSTILTADGSPLLIEMFGNSLVFVQRKI